MISRRYGLEVGPVVVRDPQVGPLSVLHDIHEVPNEDNLASIRGDLGIRGELELEYVLQREPSTLILTHDA